ncbi:hypothetical protein L1887_02423 [Cichorium endivia]|nr:hypothetical protein L1887_02423 [Cichorium endivia]
MFYDTTNISPVHSTPSFSNDNTQAPNSASLSPPTSLSLLPISTLLSTFQNFTPFADFPIWKFAQLQWHNL